MQAAFGTDTAAATRHYVEYGASEGGTIHATANSSVIESLSVTETARELPLDLIRDFIIEEDQIEPSAIDANTDFDSEPEFAIELIGIAVPDASDLMLNVLP